MPTSQHQRHSRKDQNAPQGPSRQGHWEGKEPHLATTKQHEERTPWSDSSQLKGECVQWNTHATDKAPTSFLLIQAFGDGSPHFGTARCSLQTFSSSFIIFAPLPHPPQSLGR